MSETDLPNSPIFDRLTPSQRQSLLHSAERETHVAGTTIVEEGTRTGGLWIITSGRCEVVKAISDGGRQLLAELGPGAVFGEMAFFSPTAHVASVRCVTPVSAIKLTADGFGTLERDAPELAYRLTRAVLAVVAERLRRMDEWTGALLGQVAASKQEEWSDFRAKLYNGWDF